MEPSRRFPGTTVGALCNFWDEYFDMGPNNEFGVHVAGSLNFGFADGHAKSFDMSTWRREDCIYDTIWPQEKIGWNVHYPDYP